jgi:AraC family transcriptional regulator
MRDASVNPDVPEPRIFSSDWLYMRLESEPRGVKECLGPPAAALVVHAGHSVRWRCDMGGRRHHGHRVHGDITIVPAGIPSRWETTEAYTEFSIRIPTGVLDQVAEETDVGPGRIEIVENFHLRDPQIEHVAWALRAELDGGLPNGRLYTESLAVALGTHLQNHHSARPARRPQATRSLTGRRQPLILGYIEDNLSKDLSLREIAKPVGLSTSHASAVFRQAMGMPIHQYVLERRVALAKTRLLAGDRSISDVAASVGFANQSHLAYHMRRLLGVSPRQLLPSRGTAKE